MRIQPILKRQEEREDSFNGRWLWYIIIELKYVACMMDEKKTLLEWVGSVLKVEGKTGFRYPQKCIAKQIKREQIKRIVLFSSPAVV